MSYSSYNSYIFQTNLKVLIGILATHQIISAFNIFLLKKLLHSQIVHVLETLIVIRCCYNIWRSTKHIASPVVAPYTSSFKNYLLVPGPVTKTITDFYDRLFKPSKKSTSTPPQPKIEQPTKVVDAFRIAQEIIPKYEVKQNDPTPIKSKGTNYMGAFEHMVETIKQMMEEEEQRRREEKEKNKGLLASEVSKLKFVPCLPPPVQPAVKRDRSLWHLARTPKLVDEFRMEQVEGYHSYWNKFNDERSRVYYHKLTEALLTKIFKPLLTTIKNFETILANSGQDIVTCDPKLIALTLILPELSNNPNFSFNLNEIHQFISVNGRSDVEARMYVLERIKELASSQRMAAFCGIPKVKGMPSDGEIVFYIFHTYLQLREPHIIPPLLPLEGDVFKFLLVYFKITPELSWGVF